MLSSSAHCISLWSENQPLFPGQWGIHLLPFSLYFFPFLSHARACKKKKKKILARTGVQENFHALHSSVCSKNSVVEKFIFSLPTFLLNFSAWLFSFWKDKLLTPRNCCNSKLLTRGRSLSVGFYVYVLSIKRKCRWAPVWNEDERS